MEGAYFCKVFIVLSIKKREPFIEYIRTHGVLDKLLNHLGVYSVMELLIRIGWDDGSQMGYGMDVMEDAGVEGEHANWLRDAGLMTKLVGKLGPEFRDAVSSTHSPNHPPAHLQPHLSPCPHFPIGPQLPPTQPKNLTFLCSPTKTPG